MCYRTIFTTPLQQFALSLKLHKMVQLLQALSDAIIMRGNNL